MAECAGPARGEPCLYLVTVIPNPFYFLSIYSEVLFLLCIFYCFVCGRVTGKGYGEMGKVKRVFISLFFLHLYFLFASFLSNMPLFNFIHYFVYG